MYDTQMNRLTSQNWTGYDFRDRTSDDIIESVPTAEEAAVLIRE